MNQLWTPWRLEYVSTTSDFTGSCIFCDALAEPGGTGGSDGQSALMVHRAANCYVILNKFPYNNGHLMVVFNRHIGRLADATADELTELMALTQACELALTEAYGAHGFNTGLNIGKAAGAGVVDHLHMHVVPRWNGDTNFMTVVGETRVLPEDLPQTASRLRPLFARIAG
jgi:ATP adenylyltransferase